MSQDGKKPNFLYVCKKCSFTRKEAAALLRAHVGDRGVLGIRWSLDEYYQADGRICQIGIWHGTGNYEVLGEGVTWRKAFEDAGVFFENGEKYRI